MNQTPLKVVELFAGVGGFRIALEGYPKKKNSQYEVVWSNQYEPQSRIQHANLVYKKRFPKANHCEEDIETIVEHDMKQIPDHDLLVGGFPCQDYSIANRSHNRGLEGTKGKLWWSIYALLKNKGTKAPNYILLENVDRLLRSPAHQKGRDFAVILSCLNHLDYAVEWRVINAAEYGYPQKRKRIYILAYKQGTELYQKIGKSSPKDWLTKLGIFAKAFKAVAKGDIQIQKIPESISETLSYSNEDNLFLNAGFMLRGVCFHIKLCSNYTGAYTNLGNILIDEKQVPNSYYIKPEDLPKWEKVKAAKAKERISKRTNEPYIFKEGNVEFPDSLNKPARTILPKESSSYICREKHVVKVGKRYRGLHPIELERLNGFPDNHTACEGVSEMKRGFFMGNALVIGVVRKIAKQLYKSI
jgi:DNA (cytosine-5)-methyltransferase 1